MERLRNLGIAVREQVEGAAKLAVLAPLAILVDDRQLVERVTYDIAATGKVSWLHRIAMIAMDGRDANRVSYLIDKMNDRKEEVLRRRVTRSG